MTDADTPFDRLVTLLQDSGARFRIIHHPAAGTSETVAKIRGTDPGQGAKAMLCQIKGRPETLVLAILPGNLKIAKITVNPDTVLVTMPAGRDEKQTTEVLTTPIYLESIATDSRLFTKIIARPSIQPVARRWPDVEVTIELKK